MMIMKSHTIKCPVFKTNIYYIGNNKVCNLRDTTQLEAIPSWTMTAIKGKKLS